MTIQSCVSKECLLARLPRHLFILKRNAAENTSVQTLPCNRTLLDFSPVGRIGADAHREVVELHKEYRTCPHDSEIAIGTPFIAYELTI